MMEQGRQLPELFVLSGKDIVNRLSGMAYCSAVDFEIAVLRLVSPRNQFFHLSDPQIVCIFSHC